jgi:16S rRNA (guanine1516-N2)-methyltransferase
MKDLIQHHLHYYQGDARTLIPELMPHDVIYLDPMFPPKRKQAKVKKYMQMMQIMTALYPELRMDEKQLFDIASQYATKRVVVKRPKGEEPIAPHPNYSLDAQSIRFDVYLSGLN